MASLASSSLVVFGSSNPKQKKTEDKMVYYPGDPEVEDLKRDKKNGERRKPPTRGASSSRNASPTPAQNTDSADQTHDPPRK